MFACFCQDMILLQTGSLNDGICEGEEDPERGLVAGKCYCKSNVEGPWQVFNFKFHAASIISELCANCYISKYDGIT